nr:acyl-[acyl-carrier-protein] desaturase 7, chloroplastic-like [Lolium perenne]
MLARFGCPSSCKPASSRNYCSKAPAAAMSTRRCRSAVNSRSMVAGRREEEEEEEWMRFEVLAHLEPWAEAHMLPLLKPADEAWQPSDLLPDAAALGADGFHQACLDLRARAEGVPDAQLVCLVGNMVTEEALPTYQSMSNRFEATRGATGADGTAWARWIRGWSAEENPPRRRAEPIHVALRPPRHAAGGAHRAPPHRLRHGHARSGVPPTTGSSTSPSRRTG